MINNKNNPKLLLSALFLVFLLQTVSFFAIKFSLATINSKFILGEVADNTISIVVSIVLLLILSFFLLSVKNFFTIWSVLVIAGSLSNIIDRFLYGGVVDYFSIPKIFVFNLSDLLIVTAISGITIYSTIKKKYPPDL